MIHRLVYETFMNTTLERNQWIKHRDGNELHNHISNLELINRVSYFNINRPHKYRIVDEETGKDRLFHTLKEISEEYGVSYSQINQALSTDGLMETVKRKNL